MEVNVANCRISSLRRCSYENNSILSYILSDIAAIVVLLHKELAGYLRYSVIKKINKKKEVAGIVSYKIEEKNKYS